MSSTLQFRQLTESLGAEVTWGYEGEVTADDSDSLRSAFRAFHLLVFRLPQLTSDEQRAIVSLFGEVLEESYLSNVRDDDIGGEGEYRFHSDFEYAPEPLAGIALWAEQASDDTACTKFASCARAYDLLAESMKERIADLEAIHRWHRYLEAEDFPTEAQTIHPVLFRDPTSGLTTVYVTDWQTVGFVGMDDEEAESLKRELLEISYSRGNTYTHTWQQGDLVVWNNIALQHARGVVERKQQPRTLRRMTFGNHHTYTDTGFAPRYRANRLSEDVGRS